MCGRSETAIAVPKGWYSVYRYSHVDGIANVPRNLKYRNRRGLGLYCSIACLVARVLEWSEAPGA